MLHVDEVGQQHLTECIKGTETTPHLLYGDTLECGHLAGHVGDIPGQRRVAPLGPGGEVGRVRLQEDLLKRRLVA